MRKIYKSSQSKKGGSNFHRNKLKKYQAFRFLFFILLAVGYVFGYKTTNNVNKQCSNPHISNENPFSIFNDALYTIDNKTLASLERDSIIFANAPLFQAEYIIFLDMHFSITHRNFQQKYIPLLSKPSAYLLQEGYEYFTPAPCDIDPVLNKKIRENLICLGWDEPKLSLQVIYEKLLNLGKIYNPIFAQKFADNPPEIIKKMKTSLLPLSKISPQGSNFGIFNQTEILLLEKHQNNPALIFHGTKNIIANRLIDILKGYKLEESVIEAYSKIFGKKEIESLISEVKKITDNEKATAIFERNEFMIITSSRLDCEFMPQECKRKIIKAGPKHFYDAPNPQLLLSNEGKELYRYKGITTEKEKRNLIFSKMSNWEKNAPYSKLREHLETRKYAMLYPVKG